jgi:U5 small nuclear ribonucleoprotein component
MASLCQRPELIRSVAVCGHLHHGKTLLCDLIFQATHKPPKGQYWDLTKEFKWTDNRRDEIDRQISLKCSPLTVLMTDSRDKSYVLNVMDTPGHPCFSDEVTASMRISDGVLLVVDCIEGITTYVERLVKEALRQQLKIVLFLNKLDRLVLELKLPPADGYFKLKHTLDDINAVI